MIRTNYQVIAHVVLLLLATSFATSALAAVTLERDYRLGEGISTGTGIGDVSENGADGTIVRSLKSATGGSVPADGDSVDNSGPSGAYLALGFGG